MRDERFYITSKLLLIKKSTDVAKESHTSIGCSGAIASFCAENVFSPLVLVRKQPLCVKNAYEATKGVATATYVTQQAGLQTQLKSVYAIVKHCCYS